MAPELLHPSQHDLRPRAQPQAHTDEGEAVGSSGARHRTRRLETLRLGVLIEALSLAFDLGNSFPLEKALGKALALPRAPAVAERLPRPD